MHFSVTVPASTANVGSGFDAVGLALALYDVVEIRTMPSGVTIDIVDAGAGRIADIPRDENHLIVRVIRRTCAVLGIPAPGLHLRCHNAIPHGRGLGSSAAAVVAGIAAGYTLAGRDLDHEALRIAAEFEGHTDNAAASMFGAMTIVWDDGNDFHSVRVVPDSSIRSIVAIPQQLSLTRESRQLLPRDVPHVDAAFNVGRSALLALAMTTQPELLFPATEDRLHQSYRASTMSESFRLVQDLRKNGCAAAISGAGPSVVVFTSGSVALPSTVDTAGFAVTHLAVDMAGVQVERH